MTIELNDNGRIDENEGFFRVFRSTGVINYLMGRQGGLGWEASENCGWYDGNNVFRATKDTPGNATERREKRTAPDLRSYGHARGGLCPHCRAPRPALHALRPRAARVPTANGHQSRRETRWIVIRISVAWTTLRSCVSLIRAISAVLSGRAPSTWYPHSTRMFCVCASS